jgi:hypothetical protein
LGGLDTLVWEEMENAQTVHKPKLILADTGMSIDTGCAMDFPALFPCRGPRALIWEEIENEQVVVNPKLKYIEIDTSLVLVAKNKFMIVPAVAKIIVLLKKLGLCFRPF